MKISKRYKAVLQKVDRDKEYTIDKAIDTLKELSNVKFTESLECALRLGVDPRHADQMVRGTVSLPHGTGKSVKVLVVTQGPKIQEALDAGAEYAGFQEYLTEIEKGNVPDVDVVIATPDVMGQLGKFGKILGPKGLMPNPKSGTVTPDVAKAVKEVKAGKIDFRVNKQGIIHAAVGKLDFTTEQLTENTKALISQVIKLKPATSKGTYMKTVYLSSTMGPGLKIVREELN
ncbi:MAG: 50S ribosomal protein L1 [Ignavibacteriales bacterium]|jgi:LSU ribosomal protein L1P|nr:MAG: 50S ribosomal protein L1 [Ignavibacteriaceae bacterium]MBW7873047.1 50S ribosomal protein L1 [Ignavibacteria bacterium]MCZ2142690.1 50S ribosomal protein L1 [Ignavibacteriales bacterium]OQY71320.1 MAG: 50S ribosomal protein L1 [Ignavibacteriales bacterium UTCHB3]MBV6443786.1 50S ribosomal protein L1 [Ignavibacteriaceae bacterium]